MVIKPDLYGRKLLSDRWEVVGVKGGSEGIERGLEGHGWENDWGVKASEG